MRIINPATQQVITELSSDNFQTINEKYRNAREAFKTWRKIPLSDRIAVIKNFHDGLLANKSNIAKELTGEVGKPIKQSLAEVDGAAYRIQYFLEHSEKWLTENQVNQQGQTQELLRFEPLGVVANISAWNYPLLIGVNVIVPALIAGNAVLYKPSEFSTLTGLNINRLLNESGVIKNTFQIIIGGAESGAELLKQPIDAVFFTGSYQTGKSIYQHLSHRLIPIGLELGGKDPAYVTDEIDINYAAKNLVEGCFYNNGQSCCAVERIYCHQNIYPQFVEKFIEETKKLKLGDPQLDTTDLGPLTRPQQVDVLRSQISDALNKGAKVLYGETGDPITSHYFKPTILVNVNHTMDLMREESFGPIIGIQQVASDEEALTQMLDTSYGLTAAIYSTNAQRARTIINELNVGNAYWNCCDRVSPYLPWAGRNNSGLGVTLSYLGILAFTKPKGIHWREI